MLVRFKQAVFLDGRPYSRGDHEVPEKALQCAYFHKLLKCGLVSDPESPPVQVMTDQERQQRLAAKVMAHAAKAKPKAPPETPRSLPQAAEQLPPQGEESQASCDAAPAGESDSGGAEGLSDGQTKALESKGKKSKKRA